ncbi:MAG TPA: serine hydrolase [Thermoanaerobaculia bacterium]|nr:serine hydrolase [Thermoanaerobaculia bacterium]
MTILRSRPPLRPLLALAGASLGLLALGSGSAPRLETIASVGPVELAPGLTPDARGRLSAAVAYAGASDRTRSLVLWHGGEPVVEAYFHGQIAVAPQNLKSVTKSLDSLLVGVALDRGLIASVDDPLARYLPRRMAAARDPRAARLTIRHLLTMSSGLAQIDYGAFQASPDWSAFLLAQPLLRAPGERFEYDTPATHLLSELLAEVSGGDLIGFANRNLLEPIGARIDTWRRAPDGVEMGGNDAYLTASSLAKLGELVRRGGEWEGRRVVSSEWLARSLAPQVVPPEPTINHGTIPVRGYGYLWWLIEVDGEPGYAALGHGGQYLAVFPGRELVVVVTSHWPGPSSTEHYRHLRSLFAEHLLPAFPRAEERRG